IDDQSVNALFKSTDTPDMIEEWMCEKQLWARYCSLFANQHLCLHPSEIQIISALTGVCITVIVDDKEAPLVFRGNELEKHHLLNFAFLPDMVAEVTIAYDGVDHYEQRSRKGGSTSNSNNY